MQFYHDGLMVRRERFRVDLYSAHLRGKPGADEDEVAAMRALRPLHAVSNAASRCMRPTRSRQRPGVMEFEYLTRSRQPGMEGIAGIKIKIAA